MFNNRIQTSILVVLTAVVALNVTAGSPPALAQFEFAKILASDGLEGDGFGYSVALSGDTVVIGAWFNDNHTGSAYVYRYDGLSWVQEAKLQASDRAAWDLFGWSVDISPATARAFAETSGEAVVVGAIRNADAGSFTGSAYIFRFDGSKWVEEQKLQAYDYAYWDEFGFSVAISGDIAVIGAIRNDDNDPNSGSAYVFYVAVHPGDFDADGEVDLEDFAIFASAWLTKSGKTGWNPDCDISIPADKSVGMLDLIVFAEHWLAAVE